MKPSMLSTQGMPNNRSQNSEARYPKRGTTSRGSSNDSGTQNSTQDEVLNPMPKHVQGSQIPSTQTLTTWQKRHMRSPKANRTRNVASKKIEHGGKEPMIKQKRYRSPNVKKKSSAYRGVTKCKGRFESFVWDNDPTAGKKGKTVYIGGFKNELEAARAHDLIAIKIWGKFAYTNFPESCYLKEISEMKSMTKREYILAIRRLSKKSSKVGSNGLNISRDKEETVPSSPEEQMANDVLSNKRDNEMEHNNLDELEQHVAITSLFGGQQDHDDGFNAFAGAEVEMEENNAIGDTFLNQDPTTMQPMLLEIGQESQAPIALQNQHDVSVNENLFDNQFLYDQDQDLAFQNDLSFQDDPMFPHWSFDFGSTFVEDHTNALDNALNWECSMCEMDNENPSGAENGGIGSFGLDSIGFHPLEPNNQQFEAPNLQVALEPTYEPLRYGFERDTRSQGENIVDNDLDISQYLNLNNLDMEDQETTHDLTD